VRRTKLGAVEGCENLVVICGNWSMTFGELKWRGHIS